jgi:hypothetical protein
VSRKSAAIYRAYVRPKGSAKHEGSIKGYDDAFLACRAEQHSWSLIGYYRLPDGIIGRLMVCDRCETLRRDRWDRRSGERLPSSYVYPDGYQISHNGGSPASKADMRLETMRRVSPWASEEQMMKEFRTSGT